MLTYQKSHLCKDFANVAVMGKSISWRRATQHAPNLDVWQHRYLQELNIDALSSFSLLTPNLSTHLKHQINCRLMSQPPPPERVVLGDCTLISYTLAQTEKELCGAEMLLLLAKLIHLHATLSPWQFHNKSWEMPTEAGAAGCRSTAALPSPVSLDTLNHFGFSSLVSF